ncbi:MAG: response regulator transcription factor [Thermoanaerobaculia bacterium]
MSPRSQLILIVDDDPAIRSSLSVELSASGYETLTANDGRAGIRLAQESNPDLILTDIAMPNADGFRLIESLRRSGTRTPIIVLSVRGGESDKIRALDLGADDFVVKPFSVAELQARVRAQLRRISEANPRLLSFPDLTIDLDRRRVTQGKREIRLTPTELALLELLATNAGKPVLLETIVASVWKGAPGTTADTVRVHVASLRKKIEPDPSEPHYIITEPWVGYRFIEEPLD